MTGPLTGKMPPEAVFRNRRPGASVVETDVGDGGKSKGTRALLARGSVDLPGSPGAGRPTREPGARGAGDRRIL